MARQKETLEEGLDRSASKRGFTGKERHRYIGGAIRNMEKRGEIHAKKRPVKSHAPAPARHAPPRPAPRREPEKPREKISLVARKNSAASAGKPYDVYSIYKEGEKTPYTSGLYRKMATARQEAKTRQEMFNHPKGVHAYKKSLV